MEGSQGGLRWKGGLGRMTLVAILNIYLMGIAEELENALLGELEGCGCGALCMLMMLF